MTYVYAVDYNLGNDPKFFSPDNGTQAVFSTKQKAKQWIKTFEQDERNDFKIKKMKVDEPKFDGLDDSDEYSDEY